MNSTNKSAKLEIISREEPITLTVKNKRNKKIGEIISTKCITMNEDSLFLQEYYNEKGKKICEKYEKDRHSGSESVYKIKHYLSAKGTEFIFI